MKALTALPLCLTFALLGVVESDFTLFCTASPPKVCTENEKTIVAEVLDDLFSSDRYNLVLNDLFSDEDWFTPMETFPASSRQGIRANMRAQAAMKRSRKKNAVATGVESAPLQSYEGDGFTIHTQNAEFFIDYFDQKFAVDELEVEATNQVAADTTGNSTHDGRLLNSQACCYCVGCGCCSVSGCPTTCGRRRSLQDDARRSLQDDAQYAELTKEFQSIMQTLIDNNPPDITCLDNAEQQCGSMW